MPNGRPFIALLLSGLLVLLNVPRPEASSPDVKAASTVSCFPAQALVPALPLFRRTINLLAFVQIVQWLLTGETPGEQHFHLLAGSLLRFPSKQPSPPEWLPKDHDFIDVPPDLLAAFFKESHRRKNRTPFFEFLFAWKDEQLRQRPPTTPHIDFLEQLDVLSDYDPSITSILLYDEHYSPPHRVGRQFLLLEDHPYLLVFKTANSRQFPEGGEPTPHKLNAVTDDRRPVSYVIDPASPYYGCAVLINEEILRPEQTPLLKTMLVTEKITRLFQQNQIGNQPPPKLTDELTRPDREEHQPIPPPAPPAPLKNPFKPGNRLSHPLFPNLIAEVIDVLELSVQIHIKNLLGEIILIQFHPYTNMDGWELIEESPRALKTST